MYVFTVRKRSCGKVMFFTPVCQSFCSRGGGVLPFLPFWAFNFKIVCADYFRFGFAIAHHLRLNSTCFTPWLNIKSFLQMRFFKSFWFQWWCMRYQLFFPKNILNHSSQFSKDFLEYVCGKKIVKYGHPNYVETFMDSIRMTEIFMDSCTIDTPL